MFPSPLASVPLRFVFVVAALSVLFSPGYSAAQSQPRKPQATSCQATCCPPGPSLTAEIALSPAVTVELSSFTFSVDVPVAHFGSGGSAAGKANFGELVAVKRTDASTPALLLATALGTHLAGVRVTKCLSAKCDEQLTYRFSNVLITHFDAMANACTEGPLEELRFLYSKIEIELQSGGTATHSCWDIAANKQC